MYKSCLCLRYGSIKLCVDQAKRDGVTVYELLFFPWFFRRIVKRKWDWIIYHENYLFLSISFLYIYSELFVWMMKKKQHGTKLHAIPHFLVGSFAVWDHLRSNLGIISGLGIICGAVQITLWTWNNISTFMNQPCRDTIKSWSFWHR